MRKGLNNIFDDIDIFNAIMRDTDCSALKPTPIKSILLIVNLLKVLLRE